MRSVALLALVASGCATQRPYFEASHAALPAHAFERPDLARLAAHTYRARSVELVPPDGAPRTLWTEADWEAVPTPVLVALLAHGDSSRNGVEVNLWAGSPPMPVKLVLDPFGAAQVSYGEPRERAAPAPSLDALRRAHPEVRFAAFGTPWGPAGRRAVAAALDALPVRLQAALLPHLHLVRKPVARDDPSVLGRTVDRGVHRQIEIYDPAFETEDETFSGTADAPLPAASFTVLRAMGEVAAVHTDVLEAWRAAVGDAPGPMLSRSTVRDEFVDAFALFHLDPTALRRAAPRAWAWFDNEGHFAPLGAPPVAATAQNRSTSPPGAGFSVPR